MPSQALTPDKLGQAWLQHQIFFFVASSLCIQPGGASWFLVAAIQKTNPTCRLKPYILLYGFPHCFLEELFPQPVETIHSIECFLHLVETVYSFEHASTSPLEWAIHPTKQFLNIDGQTNSPRFENPNINKQIDINIFILKNIYQTCSISLPHVCVYVFPQRSVSVPKLYTSL